MFIKPPNIISSNVRAFFTMKNSVDGNDNLCESLAKRLEISKDKIYLPVQKHTDKIHILGADCEPVIADAVVTDRKNILVGVIVADCVPILLYDNDKGVIGAVHAGWRGTAEQILINTINIMHTHFHCLPEDISLAIGPSIRQCSYEVDSEVKTAVERATGEGEYYTKKGDKYFVDLPSANRIQALSSGISEDNIWQSEDCTFCNPDKYHSYRYNGGMAGRQGGFIGMW